jgi:hypothetical protein
MLFATAPAPQLDMALIVAALQAKSVF